MSSTEGDRDCSIQGGGYAVRLSLEAEAWARSYATIEDLERKTREALTDWLVTYFGGPDDLLPEAERVPVTKFFFHTFEWSHDGGQRFIILPIDETAVAVDLAVDEDLGEVDSGLLEGKSVSLPLGKSTKRDEPSN